MPPEGAGASSLARALGLNSGESVRMSPDSIVGGGQPMATPIRHTFTGFSAAGSASGRSIAFAHGADEDGDDDELMPKSRAVSIANSAARSKSFARQLDSYQSVVVAGDGQGVVVFDRPRPPRDTRHSDYGLVLSHQASIGSAGGGGGGVSASGMSRSGLAGPALAPQASYSKVCRVVACLGRGGAGGCRVRGAGFVAQVGVRVWGCPCPLQVVHGGCIRMRQEASRCLALALLGCHSLFAPSALLHGVVVTHSGPVCPYARKATRLQARSRIATTC